MNTTKLKAFARDARNTLLSQIGTKLEFVLTQDTPLLRHLAKQVGQIKDEVKRTSREACIERIAYFWFNRCIALRFMDNNEHNLVRVVSPTPGHTLPEILEEAKQGNISDELAAKVNKKSVIDLLSGQKKSPNAQEEAYKILLLGYCNHLHDAMPFMFERAEDFTELLLPDNLLGHNSILESIRTNMTKEDTENVEIIGWLYQFYISEVKDRIITAKKRYKKHEIAPATQLFTPKWIVEYMVSNSLGQLWLEARPQSKLRDKMPFYIEPVDKENIPKRIIKSPEEITLFDPCAGSGHILVYAFELLYHIYEEEGYNPSEIPGLILEKNLSGLDIDERAVQLANFALTMKALSKQKRFLRKKIMPRVYAIEESKDYPIFAQAKTIGSLIKLTPIDTSTLRQGSAQAGSATATNIKIEEGSIFAEVQRRLKRQTEMLTAKYDIVVTNPPYLNGKYMEESVKSYVEKHYKETKSDLFACFVIRCAELTKKEGYIGYVSPFVWMFIKSYEYLRDYIINNMTIHSLVRPEYHAFFESAFVPLNSFILQNQKHDIKGIYIDLSKYYGADVQPKKLLEAIQNPKVDYRFHVNQQEFKKIPGAPIAYWVSERVREIFATCKKLGDMVESKQGLITGDNNRFLRYWNEVCITNVGFHSKNIFPKDDCKWFPLNKGGAMRKWYGNIEFIVNWKNNGYDIKNFVDTNGKIRSRPQNVEFYFKSSVSWSDITSSINTFRYYPKGFIFDATGHSSFPNLNISNEQLLSLLNNNFVNSIIKILNPTMHFHIGYFQNLPSLTVSNQSIKKIIRISIFISKLDWDSRETSWDYNASPLIVLPPVLDTIFSENHSDDGENDDNWLENVNDRLKEHYTQGLNARNSQLTTQNSPNKNSAPSATPRDTSLSAAYDAYTKYWTNMFLQLHKNEEENNRIFIEIYGLQEEMTPDVAYKDITILQQELNRKELRVASYELRDNEEVMSGELRVVREEEVDEEVTSNELRVMSEEEDTDIETQNSQLITPNSINQPTREELRQRGLPWKRDEVIKQFISYSVGCMFGRYSLYKPGLILANQGETLADYVSLVMSNELRVVRKEEDTGTDTHNSKLKTNNSSPNSQLTTHNSQLFLPDDDNIIPILADEYFTDDIVGQFRNFLRAAFGPDHFQENIDFIEDAIGKDIRSYFLNHFYDDHIRRYKKRPIYWMFSSPKGSFNALIYMHRYREDTVSRLLNNYLREFIAKLEAQQALFKGRTISEDVSSAEKTRAQKEIDRIVKMLKELEKYERDVIYPLAGERIKMDLDDGVKVNYNKFGSALQKVVGLSGK